MDDLIAPILELYRRMEDDLLENIASRLRLSEAGDPDEWLVKKLQQIGEVNAQNVNIIAKRSRSTYGKVAEAIERITGELIRSNETLFFEAYHKGLLTNIPLPVEVSPMMRYIIEQALGNMGTRLNMINTTALQSADAAFLKAINQAYLETITGTTNHREAIQKAVRTLAKDGIDGAHYISKNGRETYNHIDVAVRRAVLTSTNQATGKAQIARAQEWGSDLVEVSSHASARPAHAEWQGKIYSLSGTHPKYPNFYEATGYGTIQGLQGANCAHDFYPFIEGLSRQTFRPYEEDITAEKYAMKQEQRGLEREIRAAERELITTQAAGDRAGAAGAAARADQAQQEMQDFINRTGMTRREEREEVHNYPNS